MVSTYANALAALVDGYPASGQSMRKGTEEAEDAHNTPYDYVDSGWTMASQGWTTDSLNYVSHPTYAITSQVMNQIVTTT
jgi:hypothetical protein